MTRVSEAHARYPRLAAAIHPPPVRRPALAEGPIRIDGPAAHYLVSVMRTKVGDPVKLFDDRSGEWLGVAASVGKRDLTLDVTTLLREREAVPDLWLCAAPLKKGRRSTGCEKACELGVARLVPVVTRRTVVDKPNTERLRAHMIEAAEQCGRTALPEVAEPVKLAACLRDWPEARAVLRRRDRRRARAGGDARTSGPAAILIGPEGGFDAEEREAIRAHPSAIGIGLGPRILRADTAAAAAVSLWMAAAGDWR